MNAHTLKKMNLIETIAAPPSVDHEILTRKAPALADFELFFRNEHPNVVVSYLKLCKKEGSAYDPVWISNQNLFTTADLVLETEDQKKKKKRKQDQQEGRKEEKEKKEKKEQLEVQEKNQEKGQEKKEEKKEKKRKTVGDGPSKPQKKKQKSSGISISKPVSAPILISKPASMEAPPEKSPEKARENSPPTTKPSNPPSYAFTKSKGKQPILDSTPLNTILPDKSTPSKTQPPPSQSQIQSTPQTYDP
ncbi:ATP-dependent RNA helicase DBP3-like [Vicia villosa]|uniref:ATP-dependent RNA helicase DBP3-like n=1 Tax=Vicia villosa TaxID=3911 RepID=UPI00273C4A00|nr:ATP-dependent RNA helicase DBP3-like [Vicia villosa]